MPFTPLETTWFALIGLLWTGYLTLEGFDFGVSVVSPFVARDDLDRRLCMNAIGPVWDGNEVWLITAGGATFAAFPLWYSSLFSGFYLVLFLVLLALIIRGVSFEFRGKVDDARWRRTWDVANFAGSLIPAVVWGAAFTDFVTGVRLSSKGYTSGLLGAVHPVAVLGGLTSLSIFALSGSAFLALKTTGELSERAKGAAAVSGAVAAVLLGGLIVWISAAGRPPVPDQLPGAVPLVLAVVGLAAVISAALLASTVFASARREGMAFAATAVGIVALMGATFARMFPAVIPASNASAKGGLLIASAASHHYTLVVMTIVAAIFTPIVLLYQGWTYWVFRQRLTRPPVRSGVGV